MDSRCGRVAASVLLGLLLAGGGGAWADIELPSAPPPQPKPQVVQVRIGETVEIPLVGVSRTGAQLRFLIRSRPSLGDLSDVRVVTGTEGAVTYTHEPARGAGVDSFRYAVQAAGTRVSAAAEVQIQVVEEPPIFVAPGAVNFPAVALGESAVEGVELRNDGGGTVVGRVAVEAPFSLVAGEGEYALGPGEATEILVGFTPTGAGGINGQLTYSHNLALRTGLSARGFLPVETAPRRVDLVTDGRSEVRTGVFVVRNLTEDDRELTISGPTELVVQGTLALPAWEEREVAVHTEAGFLGALEGELRITGGPVDLAVPVQVFAAPARLVVDGAAGGLDLGTLKTGETVERTIVVRNPGGTDAQLAAREPRGISLTPDPVGEILPAGAEREFTVSFVRTVPGDYAEELVFETDESKVTIPIRATIESAFVQRSQGESAVGTARPGAGPRATLAEMEFNTYPAIEEIGVTRRTQRELDLVWDAPAPGVARYEVLRRKFEFSEDGRTLIRWDPLKNVRVRVEEGRGRAFLTDLEPGEQVTLSVLSLDAAGLRSRPSLPFMLSTEQPAPWRIPWGLVMVLIFVGCVVALVRARRHRAREAASDVDRILRS